MLRIAETIKKNYCLAHLSTKKSWITSLRQSHPRDEP